MPQSPNEAASWIAVVGVAGRFPQAPTIGRLWQLMLDETDAITEVPAERWDTSRPLDPTVVVPTQAGLLDDVRSFDPQFFGISPREAESMDPQQRLLLETCWESLEQGGIRPSSLRGSRTGVYVGALWHDYETLERKHGINTQYTALGQAVDVISARLSYFLGLTGPSLTLQTGCSSSLVALHLGAQALRSGEIDGAMIGGVNLVLAPDDTISLTHFGGLSPDGRCHAFGAKANGFVRGEGAVCVYLKRYEDAVAAGDRIAGVIVETAVNNDAGGDSLAAPNPDGQRDLLRTVYANAAIPLDDLVYLEAHGTGTYRGDPIEAGAIGEVLGQARSAAAGPLLVGSVKSNIGHLESAAGLAGFVKAMLVLENRMVPRSLHSAAPNPEIDFGSLRISVPQELIPLPLDGVVYAGVNSFGWGGTNAHALLRSAPPAPAEPPPATRTPAVVPVSAHTPAALAQRLDQLAGYLDSAPVLFADAVATLAFERDHFQHRAAVVASSAPDAAARLRALAADGQGAVPGASGSAVPVGKVCFVLPGQGSQWLSMGARLYAEEPVFRAEIDRCRDALAPLVDWDLVETLTGADAGWLEQVDRVQPALWAMSLGIAELWRAAGVRPDVVVGHSQGEITAATIAGILSHQDGARIIAERSRLAIRAAGRGRMLAVDLPIEQARQWLEGFEEQVGIAVHNGSRSCVLSGDVDEILLLQELLEADGVFCRLVRVNYASHCHHMDPLMEPLVEILAPIAPRDGEAVFVSSVAEQVLAGSELGPRYWADNLRRPVMFRSALRVAVEAGATHFIEISPHPVLNHAISQFASEETEPLAALTSLRRDEGAPEDFHRALAEAYVAGLEPFGPPAARAGAALPAYPWQRQDFWMSGGSRHRGERGGLDLKTTPMPGELDTFQARTRLAVADLPWLADHQVHTATVFPGVGMLALAAHAARDRTGALAGTIEDARFLAEITVSEAGADVAVTLAEDLPGSAACRLETLEGVWTANATARLWYEAAPLTDTPAFPAELLAGPARLSEAFYAQCSDRGLHYGPAFQGIQELWSGPDAVLARIGAPSACRPTLRPGELHPAVWDACLQTALEFVPAGRTVVPTRIARTRIALPPGAVLDEAWALALRHPDGTVDVVVYAADRTPVLSMAGIELQPIEVAGAAEQDETYLRLDWLPSSVEAGAAPARVALCSPVDQTALSDSLADAGIDATDLEPAGFSSGTVVFLAPTAADGLAAQRAGLRALAETVRSIRGHDVRVLVATRGARPDRGADDSDPGAGLYWGFGRVLRREHPEFDVRLVDLPEPLAAAGAALAAELRVDDHEDQVVRPDAGHRLVGRLVQGLPADAAPVPRRADEQAGPVTGSFRLRPARSGLFEELAFRPLPRTELAPGAVEVRVSAAALNFIDVMKAVGTYPDSSAGADLLGGECVGVVSRVGPGVPAELTGTRVAACAFGSLASHVVVRADHTVPVPAQLADAAAAALPLVCATAWYGLVDIGRLEAGETVLVHSAAGGLGLAALLLARSRGAEVIATAGTPRKRQLLRELGIEHVFNSRDLSWVDGVAAATRGRGVDIVLNSLAGAHIEAGMNSLAEDGRFVEVGKKDIYANRRVGLKSFAGGTSFAAVDIAGLMSRRPDRFARLLAEVWTAVADGVFAALPVTCYPFAAAADALREMSRGQHTGKFVLVDPGTVGRVEPQARYDGRYRGDGTYLITGGLGALGLSLARHLADHGARSLALLGRSAPGAQAGDAIAELRSRGVEVGTHTVDVGDEAALAAVLATVRAARPLVGVIHAAGVLDDAMIASVTPDGLERVLRPKIDGARHLDALTGRDPLDLFVLFSSVAGLVGNPGQAGYAAANLYLDTLAHRRRTRGRPALSVQWGPFEEIGLAAADSVRGDRLADRGLAGFRAAEAWPALDELLDSGHTVVAYAPLRPRRWFEAYPDSAAQPSWRAVRAALDRGEKTATTGGFLDAARALDEAELDALVHQNVRDLAGRVLRLDADSIDPRTPFKALGLDSLMGLELRNRLESALGVRLSPTLLWTYGSVEALVEPLRQMVLDAIAVDEAARCQESPDLVDS